MCVYLVEHGLALLEEASLLDSPHPCWTIQLLINTYNWKSVMKLELFENALQTEEIRKGRLVLFCEQNLKTALFRERTPNLKNLKALVLYFGVDGKILKARGCHDKDVISLPEFSLTHKSKMSNLSGVVWDRKHFMRFHSETSVSNFLRCRTEAQSAHHRHVEFWQWRGKESKLVAFPWTSWAD